MDNVDINVFQINSAVDVYSAIGRTIELSQQWENSFRKFCIKEKCEIKDLETSTLRRMNKALLNKGSILQAEYDRLEKVINMRNYINHAFFLEYKALSYKQIENKLNEIFSLISGMYDVTCNILKARK